MKTREENNISSILLYLHTITIINILIILDTSQNIEKYKIGFQSFIQKAEIKINPTKLKEPGNNIKCFISNFFKKILNKRESNSIPIMINPTIIYLGSKNSENKKE